MDWTIQDSGAAAEIVGAIAVIVTLVYLAVQFRQSNQLAKAESHRAYVNAWQSSALDPWYDPAVREVLGRGISDFNALSPDDKRVFSAWVAGVVHLGEELFIQSRKGLVDDEVVNVMEKRLVQNLLAKGTVACWDHIKVAYDGSFVQHVENLLASASEESVEETMPWFSRD